MYILSINLDCERGQLTVHQSMNGLPRCGVAIVVNDVGWYSVGFRCVMRCRQSNPPIECAMKLTPRPATRSCNKRSKLSERDAMDPVLQRGNIRDPEQNK